jgi:hypothetical protein
MDPQSFFQFAILTLGSINKAITIRIDAITFRVYQYDFISGVIQAKTGLPFAFQSDSADENIISLRLEHLFPTRLILEE